MTEYEAICRPQNQFPPRNEQGEWASLLSPARLAFIRLRGEMHLNYHEDGNSLERLRREGE